jgi:hypothetical protein
MASRYPADRANSIDFGPNEGGGYVNAEARFAGKFLEFFSFRWMRVGGNLLH